MLREARAEECQEVTYTYTKIITCSLVHILGRNIKWSIHIPVAYLIYVYTKQKIAPCQVKEHSLSLSKSAWAGGLYSSVVAPALNP